MQLPKVILIALILIVPLVLCHAQNVQENLWMPDGAVNATALSPSGDTLYIGGAFSYIGPHTGNTALLYTDADSSSKFSPKINGSITAIIPDRLGGWYIGGNFTDVAGVKCNNLIHIRSDNTLNKNFLPIVNNTVRKLYLQGTTLYSISDYNPKTVPYDTTYLAAHNINDGSRIPLKLNLNGYVNSMVCRGPILFVSGSFTKANGNIVRKGLAAFNMNTGDITDWNPKIDSLVYSLVIHNNKIYSFSLHRKLNNYNYIMQTPVHVIDANTGNVSPTQININGTINAHCANGSILYFGGNFTKINDTIGRKYLAAINLENGELINWNPSTNAAVNSISTDGVNIYAGGDFKSVNENIARNCLAAFDSGDGRATPWNPCANAPVSLLSVSEKKVYVGGSFNSVGGLLRNNLAAIDLKTGKATDWDPNVTGDWPEYGRIKSILLDDSLIYIGGYFDKVNGNTERKFIAALRTSDGAATSWDPKINDVVNIITKKHSVLYVGGEFTFIGSNNRGHFAAFELPSGELSKWDLYFDYGVRAIAFYNNQIIIGGAFTFSVQRNFNNHGTGVLFIASFDVENWQHYYWLGPRVDKGPVNSILVDGQTLYVGGEFKLYKEDGYTINRHHIAAFKLPSGDLISSWGPIVDRPVYSIAVTDSNVYIGGDFTSVNNTHIRKGLAGFFKKNGTLLSWDPNAWPVRSIVVSPSRHTLYVGGYFKTVSDKNSSYFLTGLNNPTDVTLPVEEFIENIPQSGIVYPNPAQDIISIKPLEPNSQHTIEIYSFLGQRVFLKEGRNEAEESFTCNIQNLPAGIYTCRIATSKQSKAIQFIIL